jgi:hypothetical protein
MEDRPSPHASQARRGSLKGSRSSTSPLLGTLLVVLLAGCAGGSDGGAADQPSGETQAAGDELRITVDVGDGAAQEYLLRCGNGTAEGSLPDAAAACAHLRDLDDPFEPVPDDAICTQQYGGPQTARIEGSWHGETVDLELSRTDGCHIAQWDRLAPLLPVRVG